MPSYIGRVNSFFFSGAPPESRKAQCFFLDPETIENLSIYFDPKKTSRIVIKKILNYYHHGEKCGKLLVGMSENPKRVSENPRRHTTVCITSDRYQQSLLLFTGVSVNLRKIPRSARPKFQRFSYPTSRHDCGGPVTQPT